MTIWQDIKAGTIPARLMASDLYALAQAGVLDPREHVELIDGEIVPMAAAKADWHSIWSSRLTRALVPALPDETRLYVEPSVTLADDVLLEPDLAVWQVGLMPTKVRGADLLLLIEVADSSLPYDLRVKAPIYARYGVREYWVVDAVRETVRVHRAPGENGYTDVEEYEAHQPVEALLGITLQLDQLD